MIKETVRGLRKNSTKAEMKLWKAVRNRKLCGIKFFRQHPIGFEVDGKKQFFIADFYCSEKKLVVEIDGIIHEKQKDYDELRTYIMNKMEIKVMRFKNQEIEHNLNKVLTVLRNELTP